MIKIFLLATALVMWNPNNKGFKNINNLIFQESGQMLQNGNIILLNNSTCSGLCDEVLINYLKKNIPEKRKDSIAFVYTLKDTALINLLETYSRSMLILSNSTKLNKLGMYNSFDHVLIKIKNYEIQSEKIIHKGTLFKKRDF